MVRPVGDIVIVDEEDGHGLFLAKKLEKKGYKTVFFDNGEKAWKVLKKGQTEILIAGIMAKKIGGIELLRLLHENNLSTDVIIYTSYGDVESYIKASRLGASEYINKPIDVDEFEKIICMTSSHHTFYPTTKVETAERRKHPRFSISEPALIMNKENNMTKLFDAIILDISLCGMLLESTCNLLKNETVEVYPVLGGKKLETSAIIRRIIKKEQSHEGLPISHMGLEFMKIPKPDHNYIKVYLESI